MSILPKLIAGIRTSYRHSLNFEDLVLLLEGQRRLHEGQVVQVDLSDLAGVHRPVADRLERA